MTLNQRDVGEEMRRLHREDQADLSSPPKIVRMDALEVFDAMG